MSRKLLIKEAAVATILITGIMVPLAILPLKSEFVKPIRQELDDFDIYDLFYTGKNNAHPGIKDSNIFLVQAGDERSKIADQINKIKSLQPAVIGIDLSFENDKEPLGDIMLKTAILGDSNIVPGYSLDRGLDNKATIKEDFLPKEYLYKQGGYMNFPYHDNFSVLRNFIPFFSERDTEHVAFTVRVAEKFIPGITRKLKERHNQSETINYYGNTEYYLNYTADEFDKYFRNNQLGFFKGKIILLGYFSGSADSSKGRIEDMFFSPMNQRPSGKSYPDIYGVVIHANILSMVIKQHDYIKVFPIWASFLFAVITSFLVNLMVLYLYKRFHHPYHVWFFFMEILAVICLVYFFIKIYDWFNVKVALLPMLLAIVLTAELFDLYKMAAKYLNRRYYYQTMFSGR